MTTARPCWRGARRELLERLAQIGRRRRSPCARAARTRGRCGPCRGRAATRRRAALPNGRMRHAIEMREADVAERRGDAPRLIELGRLAPSTGWRRGTDRSADPAPRRRAAAAAGSGACRPSSRCGGSRRRASSGDGRRTRGRGRACGASRSARFCPANARFETTCRYSSFLRKSSSKRRAMAVSASSRQSSAATPAEQLVDDRVRVHLFGLALEVEQQPMAQRRQRDGADVVDRHERVAAA